MTDDKNAIGDIYREWFAATQEFHSNLLLLNYTRATLRAVNGLLAVAEYADSIPANARPRLTSAINTVTETLNEFAGNLDPASHGAIPLASAVDHIERFLLGPFHGYFRNDLHLVEEVLILKAKSFKVAPPRVDGISIDASDNFLAKLESSKERRKNLLFVPPSL